jgi:hypothetical protein
VTGGVELGLAHLRVARPTDDLGAVARFCHDGLGLDVLYEFKGHEGFDGVMLGGEGAGYRVRGDQKRLNADVTAGHLPNPIPVTAITAAPPSGRPPPASAGRNRDRP